MLPVLGFVFPPTMSSANTSDALYARDKLPNVADSINLMLDEFRSASFPSAYRLPLPTDGREKRATKRHDSVSGDARRRTMRRQFAASGRAFRTCLTKRTDATTRDDSINGRAEKRYFHTLVRRPAPQLAARYRSRARARENRTEGQLRAAGARPFARALPLAREGV